MHSIESRFVIGPSNRLLGGVQVCIFQPENLTGWGSEGYNGSEPPRFGPAGKVRLVNGRRRFDSTLRLSFLFQKHCHLWTLFCGLDLHNEPSTKMALIGARQF